MSERENDVDSQVDSSYESDTNHSVDRASEAEEVRDFIVEEDNDNDDQSVSSDASVDYDRMSKTQRREYDKKLRDKARREEQEFLNNAAANIASGKRVTRGKKKTAADEMLELEQQIDDLQKEREDCLAEIAEVKNSKPVDRELLEELEEAHGIYIDRIDIAKEKIDAMKEKEVLVLGDYDRWVKELFEVNERKIPTLDTELHDIRNALDTRELNDSDQAALQKKAVSLKRKRTTLEKTAKRLKGDIDDYNEFQKELAEESEEAEEAGSDSDFAPEGEESDDSDDESDDSE